MADRQVLQKPEARSVARAPARRSASTDRWALRKRAACDARRQLPALRHLSREVNIT